MNQAQQKGKGAPDPKLIVWILWFAILMSVGIYGIVGYVVRSTNGIPQGENIAGALLIPFAAVSFANFVIVLILLPRLASKTVWFTYNILRFAISEMSAIFGLVYLMVGGEMPIFAGFLVASAVLLLLLAPTESAFNRFMDSKSSSNSMSPPPLEP